jgi:drug/metabolite transporter (DMT)-like permease
MVFIVIRKIGNVVNPLVLVFYTGLVGVFYAPIMMYFQGSVPMSEWSNSTSIYLISVGLLALVGQTFFNKGCQLENAGIASMTRNLDVVFVFIWSATILRDTINPLSILGAILMTICVFSIGIKKYLRNRRQAKLEQEQEQEQEKEKHKQHIIPVTQL